MAERELQLPGITAGKPIVVVPFFSDKPFWGDMIYRAGDGPRPVPFKMLSAATLADAINAALEPEIQLKAKELGDLIRQERGSETGAQSFHDRLPLSVVDCAPAPGRAAVWRSRKAGVRLSAIAASVLGKEWPRVCKRIRKRRYGYSLQVLGRYIGMSGTVGYSLKGVDVEVTKAFKMDSTKSIKSSRIAQGEKEYPEASEEEWRAVLER